MSNERIFQVLVGPMISEKAVMSADAGNQVVFKVTLDSTKQEIKAAVEKLFEVSVVDVKTLKVKGKTKRNRFGLAKKSDWKKAYVRIAEGQEIDFESIG